MSRKLGITRAAVWKHMESLRELGYEISALPHLGYRLDKSPDRLIPEEIRAGLGVRILGKKIYAYASLDSTNDTAYKIAEDGAPEGSVVIAEKQTKGKGRMKRRWVSPQGGIYMSCILRPDIEPKEVAKITLVAAVAAAQAIRELCRADALIKWPNDILVNGKKVCGILTELKAEQDGVDFVILGIGVNINTPKSALPAGAAALADETGEYISKVAMVRLLLEGLEKNYLLFRAQGFAPIREEWGMLSATLGRHVIITCHDRKIEGQAVDIDDDGALVVRLDTGLMEKVFSGDVVLAR